jgi:hypothetical protein
MEKARGRLVDPGPDEGGRFSPSPYLLQHGHSVEVAPQELRITKDSSFPKRITTQRMIDRYRVHGHITLVQWKAADILPTRPRSIRQSADHPRPRLERLDRPSNSRPRSGCH